jgi:DNA processing protein
MAASHVTLEPGQTGYPAGLLTLARPPAALFVAGTVPEGPAVAVVGTRAADRGGLRLARRIAAGLAGAGVTVISGGARGIDQAAHEGALEAGGTTVMVLGCGLGVEYPRGSSDLRDRVARSGAVISELPLDAPPRPAHFHRRNRIVAALARAVLVVQAGARSGALAVARLGREMGRPVLAVPGLPDSPRTRGTHGLLRSGALLAENAGDVLAAIGLEAAAAPVASGPEPRASGLARRLVRRLDERGEASADELARDVRHPVGEVLSALIELELEGLIACHGGCYERS